MEGKGRKMWRNALNEGPGFWEEKCGTKMEIRGIEGSAGGKGSTGMWNETQAK